MAQMIKAKTVAEASSMMEMQRTLQLQCEMQAAAQDTTRLAQQLTSARANLARLEEDQRAARSVKIERPLGQGQYVELLAAAQTWTRRPQLQWRPILWRTCLIRGLVSDRDA